MTTECPSCHKQVEHEDFLFEVKCPTCSCRFNPFMQVGDVPGLENVSESVGGNANVSLDPASMSNDEPAAAPERDFSESNALFQEIRDFGESMGNAPEPAPAIPPPVPTKAPAGGAKKAPAQAKPAAPFEGEQCLMTSGDTIHGYGVDAYIAPVSVWADFDGTAENPMKPAYDLLWAQATSSGANAILSIRWALSPDGTKVLVSGTAVRCGKIT